MSLYLTQCNYTPEAFKGLLAKPEDRLAALKPFFEAVGAKLLHLWFSGSEVIMISEGTGTAGATLVNAVMASGMVREVKIKELVTPAQMVEAAKSAAALATKYRPPGK